MAKKGRKPTLEARAVAVTIKVVPPVGMSPQQLEDEIVSNLESVNAIVLNIHVKEP